MRFLACAVNCATAVSAMPRAALPITTPNIE
jgi:hypothetical protein